MQGNDDEHEHNSRRKDEKLDVWKEWQFPVPNEPPVGNYLDDIPYIGMNQFWYNIQHFTINVNFPIANVPFMHATSKRSLHITGMSHHDDLVLNI